MRVGMVVGVAGHVTLEHLMARCLIVVREDWTRTKGEKVVNISTTSRKHEDQTM